MNNRIIVDISNFIFVSNKPQKVDAIFLPGGSHPEQPEYAARLYNKGFAEYVIPSGAVTVTTVGIACTVLTVKVQVSVPPSDIPCKAIPVSFEPAATATVLLTSVVCVPFCSYDQLPETVNVVPLIE